MGELKRLVILFIFGLSFLCFTEGKVICFRKLKKGKKCAGIIRKVSFEDGVSCCSGKGSGFAIQKQKIGKNRFRCTPCSDLNKNPFRVRPELNRDVLRQFPMTTERPKVQWGSWSPCSASCGAGWRSRYKMCGDCDQNDYENVQSRPCMDNFYCPVDGNWGPWFPWHPCTSSCGGGTRIRQRKCNYPPPAYDGRNCQGLSKEDEECNRKYCPVDGGWSEWTEFSPCSETCGPGIIRKTRRCDNPPASGGGRGCRGSKAVTKKCETTRCPQDGGLSLWSNWGPCDVSCGGGYRARTRACDSPPTLYGGKDCEGETEQLKKCNVDRPCPVDGGWSVWTNFGFCRAPKCGNGFQFRSRSCDEPRPKHGGMSCEGSAFERVACFNGRNCPVNGSWCDWSAWGACSGPCEEEDPLQARQRICECPESQYGGQTCEGEHLMVRRCEECEVLNDKHGPTAIIQLQAIKPCSETPEDEGASGFGDSDCEESEEMAETSMAEEVTQST